MPQLLEALALFAWPLIAAVVLWRVFPLVKEIVKSRAFTVKVGNMEISVQETTDQLRASLEDVQKKVEQLRAHMGHKTAPVSTNASAALAIAPRRVVWVDDRPENNALEIARLRDDRVEVIEVTSTEDALRILVDQRLDVRAVISDMVRREGNAPNRKAGLELIQQLRSAGLSVPIFVYGSARALEQTRDQVLAVGGSGATASSVELFEMLSEVLGATAAT